MILSSSFLQVIKTLKANNKIISVENTDGKFRIVLPHKTNDVRKFISKYYLAYDCLVNGARETMDSIIQGGNYCSSKRKETQATIAEYQAWLADLHEKYGTKRINYYEENHCLDQ